MVMCHDIMAVLRLLPLVLRLTCSDHSLTCSRKWFSQQGIFVTHFNGLGARVPTEPKNLPKSSPENGCCWLPGSIVGNGIASDHHRMQLGHEIQRPLPTSSLLACTYSGCVCDPIACKSFVQQVVQQQQSPLPLFTLLARTDCCTVCNDIGLNLSPQSDTLPRTTQRKRTKKEHVQMFKLTVILMNWSSFIFHSKLHHSVSSRSQISPRALCHFPAFSQPLMALL